VKGEYAFHDDLESAAGKNCPRYVHVTNIAPERRLRILKDIPMKTLNLPKRYICGIDELAARSGHGITHVLSLVDPELPEMEHFESYGSMRRMVLKMHDIIEPKPGMVMPDPSHMKSILEFGHLVETESNSFGSLLVHCHMGVSRSTAAMVAIMAQAHPEEEEEHVFETLRRIRPQAWPNSLMVAYADDQLGRNGKLNAALRHHYGHQIKAKPDMGAWMSDLGRKKEVDMAE
jgi:predicted protein tyrosine phosphatase